MAILVVDTNVISYGFRGDTRFDRFRPLLTGNDLFISFMTVAELNYWGVSRNWGLPRRRQLDAYVDQHFAVYPATRRLCEIWSDITVEAKNQGRTISNADAWIAATAVRLEAPLMTCNAKDFSYLANLQVVHGG